MEVPQYDAKPDNPSVKNQIDFCQLPLHRGALGAPAPVQQPGKLKIEPPSGGTAVQIYRKTFASVSRKDSSPHVLILKNMAWLPPEVTAHRWMVSPLWNRVTLMLTRLDPA